jgi:hypothetical protein
VSADAGSGFVAGLPVYDDCWRCLYWHQVTIFRPADAGRRSLIRELSKGECRRRAPLFRDDENMAAWPITVGVDFCGEFTEMEVERDDPALFPIAEAGRAS